MKTAVGPTLFFEDHVHPGTWNNTSEYGLTGEDALALFESAVAANSALANPARLARASRTIETRASRAEKGFHISFHCAHNAELDLAAIRLLLLLMRATEVIDDQCFLPLAQETDRLAQPPERPLEPEAMPDIDKHLMREHYHAWSLAHRRIIQFVLHGFDLGGLSRLRCHDLSVVLRTARASTVPLLTSVRLVVAGELGPWNDTAAVLMACVILLRTHSVASLVVLCHDLTTQFLQQLWDSLWGQDSALSVAFFGHSESDAVTRTAADLSVVVDTPDGAVREAFSRFESRNEVRHRVTVLKTAKRVPTLAQVAEVVASDSRWMRDRLLQAMRYSRYHGAMLTRLFVHVVESGGRATGVEERTVALTDREKADVRRLAASLGAVPHMVAGLPAVAQVIETTVDRACRHLHRFLTAGVDAVALAYAALPAEAADAGCSVCMEPARAPLRLGCGHAFCAGCILQWAKEHPSCPQCRAAIGEMRIGQERGALVECCTVQGARSKVRALAKAVAAFAELTLVLAPPGCVRDLAAEIQNHADVHVEALAFDDPGRTTPRAICSPELRKARTGVLVTEARVAALGIPVRPRQAVVLTHDAIEAQLAGYYTRHRGAEAGAVLRMTCPDTVDDVCVGRLDQRLAAVLDSNLLC